MKPGLLGFKLLQIKPDIPNYFSSFYGNHKWEIGKLNYASCSYQFDSFYIMAKFFSNQENFNGNQSPCPHPDRRCGFYASYRPTSHLNDCYFLLMEGGGKLIRGEKGFRCEKARLVGIMKPDPFVIYRIKDLELLPIYTEKEMIAAIEASKAYHGV